MDRQSPDQWERNIIEINNFLERSFTPGEPEPEPEFGAVDATTAGGKGPVSFAEIQLMQSGAVEKPEYAYSVRKGGVVINVPGEEEPKEDQIPKPSPVSLADVMKLQESEEYKREEKVTFSDVADAMSSMRAMTLPKDESDAITMVRVQTEAKLRERLREQDNAEVVLDKMIGKAILAIMDTTLIKKADYLLNDTYGTLQAKFEKINEFMVSKSFNEKLTSVASVWNPVRGQSPYLVRYDSRMTMEVSDFMKMQLDPMNRATMGDWADLDDLDPMAVDIESLTPYERFLSKRSCTVEGGLMTLIEIPVDWEDISRKSRESEDAKGVFLEMKEAFRKDLASAITAYSAEEISVVSITEYKGSSVMLYTVRSKDVAKEESFYEKKSASLVKKQQCP